jgi:outer membrane protein TolC
MTSRVPIAACLLTASLLPTAAGAESPAAERLTLAAAVQLAVANNRQVETARLQVEKAEADLATARTRRLPVFETEVSVSQLLTPVDFAFPQGAFGTFPGTGPIPAAAPADGLRVRPGVPAADPAGADRPRHRERRRQP